MAARVDGIEHCCCLDESGASTPPDLATAIAAAGIAVCPTLGHDLTALADIPPAVRALAERAGVTVEQRPARVGQLHRAGMRLISGADSGISAGAPVRDRRRLDAVGFA